MGGYTDRQVPDQSGKCFVVTGANTGLGFETARVLAGRGARVLLGCRDAGRAQAAIAAILLEHPGAALEFLPIDLGNLAGVRAAAAIVAREPRIDVLVNNAGIVATRPGQTQDGFEQHIGVNHLGTFALTLLLLPRLAETPGARIVVTASLAHKAGSVHFERWRPDSGAKPSQCYADSKLANMLFLAELDRRLRANRVPVTAVGCHPGFAATTVMRDLPPFAKALTPVFGWLVNSPLQGAWPTLQAACDPGVASGDYYGPQRIFETQGRSGPAVAAPVSRDVALADALWKHSEEATGVTAPAIIARAPSA